MSPETLAREYLSLRAYLQGTVLPVALLLSLALFGVLALGAADVLPGARMDRLAAIMGGLALGAGAHRGVDVLAYRMAHDALMRSHPRAYRERLQALEHPPRSLAHVGLLMEWMESELGVGALRR